MKAWRYVIVNDYGAAPNYGPPQVTLAICKPRIRKGAQPGDLVVAFAGRPIDPDPNRVVWIGVVREKLAFEQYWSDPRFQTKKPTATDRPDNIYRPTKGGLRQVPNRIHSPYDVERDVGGRFVLVFKPAWHLELTASAMPEQFSMLRLDDNNRRGELCTELSDEVVSELLAWAAARRRSREAIRRNPQICRRRNCKPSC